MRSSSDTVPGSRSRKPQTTFPWLTSDLRQVQKGHRHVDRRLGTPLGNEPQSALASALDLLRNALHPHAHHPAHSGRTAARPPPEHRTDAGLTCRTHGCNDHQSWPLPVRNWPGGRHVGPALLVAGDQPDAGDRSPAARCGLLCRLVSLHQQFVQFRLPRRLARHGAGPDLWRRLHGGLFNPLPFSRSRDPGRHWRTGLRPVADPVGRWTLCGRQPRSGLVETSAACLARLIGH